MTDEEITKAIQDRYGTPWFNGEAYADYRGYRRQSIAMRTAVDDLDDLIGWLRQSGQYPQADRLREIRNRLNASWLAS